MSLPELQIYTAELESRNELLEEKYMMAKMKNSMCKINKCEKDYLEGQVEELQRRLKI
jgi:hypothetical protein